MPARKTPSFICATCGKRRPVKGRMRSRHTGNYFCTRCVAAEVRKPVVER
jgi:hypothetical protein